MNNNNEFGDYFDIHNLYINKFRKARFYAVQWLNEDLILNSQVNQFFPLRNKQSNLQNSLFINFNQAYNAAKKYCLENSIIAKQSNLIIVPASYDFIFERIILLYGIIKEI